MANVISNIWNNQLFLGSQCSSCKEILEKYEITHVISVGCNSVDNECNGVCNYKFDVDDNSPNLQLFFTTILPQIHDLINTLLERNHRVLVHCQVGISRSATAVITWLMRFKQMDYYSAYSHVKKCRPIISPNVMFTKRMRYYETDCCNSY